MNNQQEAMLRTIGANQATLLAKVDELSASQAAQTVKLDKIDTETADMRAAWIAASGGWKVLEWLSKVAKVLWPIFGIATIAGSVVVVHTKGYWKQFLEILK